MQGYDFTRDQIPKLIELGFIPEQPRPEARVIMEWLRHRAELYDRFSFSVRVGIGTAANPDHELGIQRSTELSSKKRIDVLAWDGENVTLVEAKRRLSADAHGKLLMYRQLYLEENPDGPEPRLVAIAEFADPDVLRIFASHGIDVYLYESTTD